MRFNLADQLSKNSVSPKGVIHIGANKGQELKMYRRIGFKKKLFFEPLPDMFNLLKNRLKGPDEDAYRFALSDKHGINKFYRTDNIVSSSLLKPKDVIKHQNIKSFHSIEVVTLTLDEFFESTLIDPGDYNVIVIDVEGAELRVFKGANNTLGSIEAICSEVNHEPLYEGCCQKEELDGFMKSVNFKEVIHKFGFGTKSYGDSMYVKSL